MLFSSIQFTSVTQLCLTLCDPVNRSTPGLPVHHQLPEFTQIHVHWVGDAIQSAHPLSSASPPALNLSQHQGLFQWVSSSHQVAKYWSFSFSISPSNKHPMIIQWSPSGWIGWIFLQFKGLSRVFPKPQSKRINSSTLSFLYSPTLTSIYDYWKNHSSD